SVLVTKDGECVGSDCRRIGHHELKRVVELSPAGGDVSEDQLGFPGVVGRRHGFSPRAAASAVRKSHNRTVPPSSPVASSRPSGDRANAGRGAWRSPASRWVATLEARSQRKTSGPGPAVTRYLPSELYARAWTVPPVAKGVPVHFPPSGAKKCNRPGVATARIGRSGAKASAVGVLPSGGFKVVGDDLRWLGSQTLRSPSAYAATRVRSA